MQQTQLQNFFTPIGNTKPYLKAALQGFAGSGKTYTAGLLAIGLHKRIESKKPIIIFDTEAASKFLKPVLAEAGIEALVRESRSMEDLRKTMDAMRNGAGDILLIDSLSHLWENFLEAYKQKVRRTRLEFQDWGIIKPTWKTEFSDPFVRDPYHVIMTGRAGYEYESEVNEETHKREIFKSGVKMKVEGETAYEPDLLVMMERYENILGEKKEVWREATVLKDRSTTIDGKTFKNPSYADFSSTIEVMLANPTDNVEVQPEGNAALLFKTEDEKWEWRRNHDKALEELEAFLVSVAPGQSSNEKKFKVDILYQTFGTASWTAIKELKTEDIVEGYRTIVAECVDRGLAAYKEGGTIQALQQVEKKNDPEQEKEVADTIKKSPKKAKSPVKTK